jgi:ABC-2 type transport system permease protein
MRKYLFAAWTTIRIHTLYRAEVVLSILTALFTLAVQVYLWKSLYAGAPGAMDVSADAMITYFIIGSTIGLVLRNADQTWQVAEDVKKGVIAAALCRPVRYPLHAASTVAGGSAFSLVFAAAPLAVAGALLFHVQGPASPAAAVLALVVTLAAMVLYFVLWLIVGMISFWLQEMPWSVPSFIAAVMWFFSGAVIPLWIYPPWLRAVADVLPARYAYDLPLSLYIGRASPADGLAGLAGELAWIAALVVVAAVVWKAGIRRLTIQGG